MKREEGLFIGDILKSIANIKDFTKTFSKEKFMKDRKTQSAVIRELEIIGEAVKNISDKTKKRYPKIEWKNIAGARDMFIHGYFQVDYERVWIIVKTDLPKLKKEIEKINLKPLCEDQGTC